MLLSLLGLTTANLIFLVLHVTNSGSFPRPLTAAEERHYLELLRGGDLSAKNVLIEHNLRLVAHIIKKYYSNARDQDDLISIGTIGLIKAVSTFDSEKGTRLATYAARCIENAIVSLRKHSIFTDSILFSPALFFKLLAEEYSIIGNCAALPSLSFRQQQVLTVSR